MPREVVVGSRAVVYKVVDARGEQCFIIDDVSDACSTSKYEVVYENRAKVVCIRFEVDTVVCSFGVPVNQAPNYYHPLVVEVCVHVDASGTIPDSNTGNEGIHSPHPETGPITVLGCTANKYRVLSNLEVFVKTIVSITIYVQLTGGVGGDVNITSGTGGTGANDTGGNGGDVNVLSGTGGTGGTAGNGGNVNIDAGTGDTDGNIIMGSLPTSNPVVAGALWSNSGVLTVSAG